MENKDSSASPQNDTIENPDKLKFTNFGRDESVPYTYEIVNSGNAFMRSTNLSNINKNGDGNQSATVIF